MILQEDERSALFIDGPNLFSTAKALEFGIDYGQLLALFQKRCRLVRALYYTPIVEGDGPSAVKPLLDWLDYNGYTIVSKPVRPAVNQDEQRREFSRMHVEFTIDALKLAPSLDHVIIFSGDREYTALVNELRQMSKRVSIVSTLETQPSMVADELRRAADQFIDLADLEPMISREMADVKVPT
ncbi:MAG: NYN domain-containing protein [Pseudomonadota bacterium]